MNSTTARKARIAAILALGAIFLSHAQAASTTTVNVTVAGTAQPWSYTPGGLNTNFQFGINDGGAPLVVNAASGISFAAGGTITVQYLSGLVSAGSGFAAVDAGGNTQLTFNNNPGNSGKVAPSAYMNPASYPIFLTELVGTFATSTGLIVGTPFKLANGPTQVVIPSGATQLQLGVNDDIYADNTGSWLVSVTGPSVTVIPEPASVVLAATAVLAGFGYAGRRRRERRIVR
jgi:hypothetical protein